MLDIDIFYTAGVGVDATGFSDSRLASPGRENKGFEAETTAW